MDPPALRILRTIDGLSEHWITFFDASSISEPVFVCAPEKSHTRKMVCTNPPLPRSEYENNSRILHNLHERNG